MASDANNPEPFSGFEIGYAPLYEDGTYCDAHWPCASDEKCEDNLCVKKKSSNSRAGKKFRRTARDVGIGLAIAVGVLVAALGAYYARRVVEQKDALEAERAHVVRDQCDEASDSTGGGTAEPISLAPDDDLWANSPPGSRTNASTPREVSWTDPEAVERRHITLQPTLPKTPSQEQRGHVHV